MNLENAIKEEWEKKNKEGIITYRFETLTTKEVQAQPSNLFLVHNGSRDVYDKAPKQISKPKTISCPFCDDSNPEMARTEDGKFRILGNRFACMQYQSILAPIDHLESITLEYLVDSMEFAYQHPDLTLLCNARNAGKTVSHLFWLLSFQQYQPLVDPKVPGVPICIIDGVEIIEKNTPAYRLEFECADLKPAANILYQLIKFLDDKNYNIFIHARKIYLIPRENIEIPDGFDNHRFGGLEMIGYFIMKSKEALENARPDFLISGIRQISYKQPNQNKLETFLCSLMESA